ncbi:MAG: bifunctional methylenetetrahydrofolate dehydrogenase/methenyltetrahydrofolate cyclohydrolase FolD, partial [Clostridia bacterium]|nr:bifunctional methylenetetrahydrofolate dehydrogenase/methenyltetrahydrofolate cyclohydrolase FolD [Clostridia bacterium]
MNIINGKEVSKSTRQKVAVMVKEFIDKKGRIPCLAVILVGEDPASQTYVKNKIIGCEEVGMKSLSFRLPADSTNEEVAKIIKDLAVDNTVDGILIQLPLPKQLDERYLLSLIPDSKDVDGFSPNNLGLLAMNNPRTVSCTPYGVMELLASTGVSLSGKNAVVIGRSNTVGKPMAMLLLNANCTVTICHSKTQNMAEITRQADILVVAIGKPKFVTEDMVKEGAIVIDVGINRVDGKLVGDVDFENVSKKASFITPVPGGVGPMTISMLLYNTLMCAKYED